MKNIPIFFTYNDNYVVPSAVAFESLLTNARADVFYELYVIHSDITFKNQENLKSIIEKHKNATIQFIDIKTIIKDFNISSDDFGKGCEDTIFTKEGLYRCIADIIPQFNKYDKIIYSDVDIVVVDDISELIDIDLKEKYLASFRAPNFLKYERLHLPKKFHDNYFGGGLYVLNLDKLRKDNIGNKAIEMIKNPPYYLKWNEQDIMNILCDLKVEYFSYRYVSIPAWNEFLSKLNYFDEFYPNEELYDAMYRPKIIHFAGKKPWLESKPPKSDLWYYYLTKTLFKTMYNKNDFLMYNLNDKLECFLFSFLRIPMWICSMSGTTEKLKIKLFKKLCILKFQKKRVKHD